jgi:hypothetical protein
VRWKVKAISTIVMLCSKVLTTADLLITMYLPGRCDWFKLHLLTGCVNIPIKIANVIPVALHNLV